jgi:hypothetical protein
LWQKKSAFQHGPDKIRGMTINLNHVHPEQRHVLQMLGHLNAADIQGLTRNLPAPVLLIVRFAISPFHKMLEK